MYNTMFLLLLYILHNMLTSQILFCHQTVGLLYAFYPLPCVFPSGNLYISKLCQSILLIVSKKILWTSFIFLCGFLFSVPLTAMLISCWVTDFFITEITCSSFLRSLNLICLMSIDTLAFFWLVFAWYIFFLLPICNLSLSLYIKVISERAYNGTYFTIWSDNLCF